MCGSVSLLDRFQSVHLKALAGHGGVRVGPAGDGVGEGECVGGFWVADGAVVGGETADEGAEAGDCG